jgi:hypothetical protein
VLLFAVVSAASAQAQSPQAAQTLEQRVAALEAQVTDLSTKFDAIRTDAVTYGAKIAISSARDRGRCMNNPDSDISAVQSLAQCEPTNFRAWWYIDRR